MMTLLIFKGNVQSCPYNEFSEDSLWLKVTNMFINDCCSILSKFTLTLELPNESGFCLSTLAGMIAMPQILKAEQILRNKKEIINEKELPYEIHLPDQLKFHSLFICPVTKDISTLENPPMLLTCGHVVSQYKLEFNLEMLWKKCKKETVLLAHNKSSVQPVLTFRALKMLSS